MGAVLGWVVSCSINSPNQNQESEPETTKSEALSVSVVFDRIKANSELVSASQKYNIVEKIENVVRVPFIEVPILFTGNSYWYRYVGEIKVGVDLSKADFSEEGDVIKVSLPQPYVSANTPDRELSGVLEENNNILNPIHIEDIDAFLNQCQEVGEEQAKEGGILDVARENTEENLRSIFNAAFGDRYKVEFAWQETSEENASQAD